jgi:hypothetical protein
VAYAVHTTEPALRYYQDRLGYGPDDYLLGGWTVFRARSLGEWETIREDLRRLRGRERVWVVVAYLRGHEREFIHFTLGRLGVPLDYHGEPGVDVHLYDLRGGTSTEAGRR